MGTLLTLRDIESAAQLGQELEVSRRLAAIGRLTAGVGHEVKNQSTQWWCIWSCCAVS